METGTTPTTTTETSTSVSLTELEPYLKDYSYNLNLMNGLLFVLIVYMIIKDVCKYINSWIHGGMM